MTFDYFEKLIFKAIETTGASDAEERLKVYIAAISALSKSSDLNSIVNRQRLKSAFIAVERSYANPSIEFDLLLSKYLQIGEFDQAGQGIELCPADANSDRSETKRYNFSRLKKGVSSPLPNVVIVITGIFLLGIIGYGVAKVHYSSIHISEEIVEKNDNKVASQIETYNHPELDTNGIVINLPDDAKSLSTKLSQFGLNTKDLEQFLKETDAFIIKQNTTLFPGPVFRIKSEKQYFMKIEFKIHGDQKKSPIIHAGFVTFDSNEMVETDKPGPHRYFVHKGKFKRSDKVREAFILSNLIEGRGNKNHRQFRKTTTYVRPIIWFGLEKGIEIELLNIEITEL